MTHEGLYITTKKENSNYQLFASGLFVDNKDLPLGDFISYPETVVILFYYFKGTRIAFIVREDTTEMGKTFTDINKKVKVLYQAQGRSFDQLKNAVLFFTNLTSGNYYYYKNIFFYKLGSLIDSRNNGKCNLTLISNHQIQG